MMKMHGTAVINGQDKTKIKTKQKLKNTKQNINKNNKQPKLFLPILPFHLNSSIFTPNGI